MKKILVVMILSTSLIYIRVCFMVSRSLIITVLSSNKSIVIQKGLPYSSCLLYHFLIEPAASKNETIRLCNKFLCTSFAKSTIIFLFLTRGNKNSSSTLNAVSVSSLKK